MKKPTVIVTDHAVIRYLERVLLVDVEGLRRRIGRQVDRNLQDELPVPFAVVANGVRYRIRNGHVVTCLPKEKPGHRRRRRRVK